MNLTTLIAMMLSANYAGDGKSLLKAPMQPRAKKQCLQCGATHRHNNAWCSAECCKEYRAVRKAA